MIKIGEYVTPSPEWWEIIMKGVRNPKNSWNRKDSYSTYIEDPETLETASYAFFMGDNDHSLASSLCAAGSDHRKFLRQLPVAVEITAPLYWWKEFDTYKVGTTANSCSTMHKILDKPFELCDFSHDNLDYFSREHLCKTIDYLNNTRNDYIRYSEEFAEATILKSLWWQIIQLLPSSYNQLRTVTLNYENLVNMYHARKHHKLTEWRDFCEWIKTLPYAELITGGDVDVRSTAD